MSRYAAGDLVRVNSHIHKVVEVSYHPLPPSVIYRLEGFSGWFRDTSKWQQAGKGERDER